MFGDRRPIVAIEDHLYHTGELLAAIADAAPARLADLTVCAIDRSGPDTAAAVADWRRAYPAVRVVTLEEIGAAAHSLTGFARAIAALVRAGGLVLQDVQLSTLPFIPADRWWETIYVGATVRGLFAERPPLVRFCSNKRGYDATFGKELLDAGFDPRDVMDKTAMRDVVAPAVLRLATAQFPWTATLVRDDVVRTIPVADADRGALDDAVDVALWLAGGRATLSGRAVAGGPLALKPGSAEIDTWRALIDDRRTGGGGVAVLDVGARLAPAGAERAEITNLAARHLHSLRARLTSPDAIVTANHAYRLVGDVLSVAEERPLKP